MTRTFGRRAAAGLLGTVFAAQALMAQAVAARAQEPPKPDCTCRAAGENFVVGATICLSGRLARCEMDQNMTTWRPTTTACPMSRLDGPARTGEPEDAAGG